MSEVAAIPAPSTNVRTHSKVSTRISIEEVQNQLCSLSKACPPGFSRKRLAGEGVLNLNERAFEANVKDFDQMLNNKLRSICKGY